MLRSRPAMATVFTAVLRGEDDEHLEAVAEAALDEVERVERLLSRFDRRSEVARLNREAARHEVLVDREVFGILQACHEYWRGTDGSFDITATSPHAPHEPRPTMADVVLDEARRTVRFVHPATRLDLGAIGKGYALDRAGEIVAAQGVAHALLDGGTSSTLARGIDAEGRPWSVGLRDPFSSDIHRELLRLRLVDQCLASSAVLAAGGGVSDLVDPRTGTPLAEQRACTILAPTATEAEILSTALACMGRERAAAYTQACRRDDLAVIWVEGQAGSPRIEWLLGKD